MSGPPPAFKGLCRHPELSKGLLAFQQAVRRNLSYQGTGMGRGKFKGLESDQFYSAPSPPFPSSRRAARNRLGEIR
jgi:hypothetical protein